MKMQFEALGLSVLLFAASACQSKVTLEETAPSVGGEAFVEESSVDAMNVMGSLVYRQRIALPPDAAASIFVFEQGPADAPAVPVADAVFDLNGRQVPIPFEVVVPGELELGRDILSLRAQIHDNAGALIWTSDTANLFERRAGDYEIGAVQLVPTSMTVITMDELTAHEWMVARMDGEPLYQDSKITMNFGKDGRLSGSSSCNSYTGSFKLQSGQIYTGPMAMTRRGCMVPLMDQELSFAKLIEDNPTAELDADGVLTLRTETGRVLTAR